MATAESEALNDLASAGTGSQTHQDVSHESDQDVNVDEGFASANLNQALSWFANGKRTYDRVEEEIGAQVKAAQDHLNNLRTIQTQMLSNMAVNTDALFKQHLSHRDIATDRTWNINETDNAAVVALMKLIDAVKATEGK